MQGKKQMDLRVVCAAQDLSELPQEGLSFVFQELTELIRQHRTTLDPREQSEAGRAGRRS